MPPVMEEIVNGKAEIVRLVHKNACSASTREGVFSGTEEFLSKIDELRTQVDEMSKKIGALWDQKSRILDQVGDRVADNEHSIRVFL